MLLHIDAGYVHWKIQNGDVWKSVNFCQKTVNAQVMEDLSAESNSEISSSKHKDLPTACDQGNYGKESAISLIYHVPNKAVS